MNNRKLQSLKVVYSFEAQNHLDALKNAFENGDSSFWDLLPTPGDDLWEDDSGGFDFWEDMDDSDLPLYSSEGNESDYQPDYEFDADLSNAWEIESGFDHMTRHPVSLIIREEMFERQSNIRIR